MRCFSLEATNLPFDWSCLLPTVARPFHLRLLPGLEWEHQLSAEVITSPQTVHFETTRWPKSEQITFPFRWFTLHIFFWITKLRNVFNFCYMQNFVSDAMWNSKESLPTEFCGLIHLSIKSKIQCLLLELCFFWHL